MKNTCQCSTPAHDVHNGRRKLLNRLWLLFAGLATLEFGWLSISILKSSQRKQHADTSSTVVTVGEVSEYTPNTVTAIPDGRFYLACLTDGSFLALSRTCTHLGCSVPWDSEVKKFVCPCHGSTFDITGEVLTPPATRALESYPLRIENGIIIVNTSRPVKRLQNGKSRSVHS